MTMALLESVRYDRVKVAQSAATADITSDSIDMAVDGGYRGVQFLVHFGTIVSGAATTIKVQESSNDSSFSDLTGSAITVLDTNDDGIAVTDIYRPTKQYLRCIVTRATQNSTVDAITAVLYQNNTEPVSQASEIIGAEIHISPLAGTA